MWTGNCYCCGAHMSLPNKIDGHQVCERCEQKYYQIAKLPDGFYSEKKVNGEYTEYYIYEKVSNYWYTTGDEVPISNIEMVSVLDKLKPIKFGD